MSARRLAGLKELKSCHDGQHVTFRARVLRSWQVGRLHMSLVGDGSALTRVEHGDVTLDEGSSYDFRDAIVQAYPGGWHSASITASSTVIPLDLDVDVGQDEAYIERTFKILSGVQRKKARAAGRIEPWRHPARAGSDES